MANSFTDYVGDGSTTLYNVPFSYIDRSHVDVLVDGVSASFSWITGSTVDVTPAPANGANVRIRRTTPKDPVVDFQDGENLTEQDLDNVNRQGLFLAQETEDNLTENLSVSDTGQYDAANRRIENLGTPVNPKDAVTKAYADTVKDASVAAVQAAQATAEAAIADDMAAAAASADDADASAQAAALSASAAAASESAALTAQGAAEAAEAGAEAAQAAAESAAASFTYASQAEAEAGVVTDKMMSPYLTKAAINALIPPSGWIPGPGADANGVIWEGGVDASVSVFTTPTWDGKHDALVILDRVTSGSGANYRLEWRVGSDNEAAWGSYTTATPSLYSGNRTVVGNFYFPGFPAVADGIGNADLFYRLVQYRTDTGATSNRQSGWLAGLGDLGSVNRPGRMSFRRQYTNGNFTGGRFRLFVRENP